MYLKMNINKWYLEGKTKILDGVFFVHLGVFSNHCGAFVRVFSECITK